MDFTKEDFAKQYSTTATVDLLKILERRSEYNPLAIEAIVDEVKRRGISKIDILDYQQQKIIDQDTLLRNEKFVDLNFAQKVFLFFIPVWNIWYLSSLSGAWMKEGYLLKMKRGRFFTYSGLASYLISGILADIIKCDLLMPCSIIIVFFISMCYDIESRKNRQIEYNKIYKKNISQQL
jgi:hypothetical protein